MSVYPESLSLSISLSLPGTTRLTRQLYVKNEMTVHADRKELDRFSAHMFSSKQ